MISTRKMLWTTRRLLLTISVVLAFTVSTSFTAGPVDAQADSYGPSVSTDREDYLGLLGVSWLSDAFYVFLMDDSITIEKPAGARFPNGVEKEPWLGN